jgi:MarR family transcriptional regulator, transcriptional regulator for hemolysin
MHQLDPDSFGFLVTDVARLIRAEMDRRVTEAGIGLTPAESRTLVHAARAGAVRQNVLAERMGVEPMTLSGFLDRLEDKGLVTRTVDPHDRRARLVEVTAKADAALPMIHSIAVGIFDDASSSVRPAEWQLLMATLRTVRQNLAEIRVSPAGNDRSDAA